MTWIAKRLRASALPHPQVADLRAAAIGCFVLATSLGLWHQVLATTQAVNDADRFVAFGFFTAGLFTFAFLLGSRSGR